MKDKRLYIFFGYWIEYTLNPLYQYMKEQGYNCIEITPSNCIDMRKTLLKLNAKENIFITSAHVFIDNTSKKFNDTHLAALEAIDILSPQKKIYYPHDFTDLLEECGMPWLNSIFDLILFPIDGYAHLACNGKSVYNVGWIKKIKKTGNGERFKVGHGIGEWGHHIKKGSEHIQNVFKKIWEQGVIVKSANTRTWEEQKLFFEKNNVNYIDSSRSIFDLIDTCEIMLTNGITSVNIESALSGRYTINMLDNIVPKEVHEKFFKGVPNLKMMPIEDTAELLKAYYKGDFIPEQGEDILKPFDFKKAVELIIS